MSFSKLSTCKVGCEMAYRIVCIEKKLYDWNNVEKCEEFLKLNT